MAEVTTHSTYQYVIPQYTNEDTVTTDDLVTGLQQTTSCHGLSHIARARGSCSSNTSNGR